MATTATRPVWPGRPTEIWTFGGSYPSPTLRVRRGEMLSMRLENRLSEPTNVHWHGLLAPSDMDGLPMDLAGPGTALDYVFRVDQRAGTYWYHPHPDMRTAFQVYSGMAGFLLVEDDEEQALGLPSGEFDVPILLQDRRLLVDRSFRYQPSPMDLMNGYLGDVGLANGVPEASLRVATGLYRLRLLNGSNGEVVGRHHRCRAGTGEGPCGEENEMMSSGFRVQGAARNWFFAATLYALTLHAPQSVSAQTGILTYPLKDIVDLRDGTIECWVQFGFETTDFLPVKDFRTLASLFDFSS